MHREPEWDIYARTEAVALVRYEATRCPRCGGPLEAYVPTKNLERDVHWDGRVFRVDAMRCLNCMARTIVERDQQEAEKDLKPVRNTFHPSDGRVFASRETTPTNPLAEGR